MMAAGGFCRGKRPATCWVLSRRRCARPPTRRFDDVFDEGVDNAQLYVQTVQPLVGTIFRGGKGTCFAYGQTGSGKVRCWRQGGGDRLEGCLESGSDNGQ